MSILTAAQVIKHSPASKDFPTGVICDHINKWERAAFKGCLGFDFQKELESNKVNYSDSEKWDEDEDYTDGDIVEYKGCYYIFSLVQLKDEIDFPNCSVNWKEPDVFLSDCYNSIFTELAGYLALFIYNRALPLVQYANGANGLQIQKSDNNGGEAVSQKEFIGYRKAIECECADCLEALKDAIELKSEEGCDFTSVEFLKANCVECKDEVSSSQRRFMFRY